MTLLAPILPLRDVRTMVGTSTHQTPEEIEAAWEAWIRQPLPDGGVVGLPMRKRVGDLSLEFRESPEPVSPYVTAGKWIAECPNCNDGVACAPLWERGACLGCGTIYPVEWKAGEEEIRAAAALLALRPEQYRWWRPDLGETAASLAAENDAHGWSSAGPVEKALVSIADLEAAIGKKGVKKLRDAGVIGGGD